MVRLMTEAIRHGRRPGQKIMLPAVGQPSTTQWPFDAATLTRAQTKQTRQMRYGAGSGRENRLFFHRISAVRGGNLLYVWGLWNSDMQHSETYFYDVKKNKLPFAGVGKLWPGGLLTTV